MITTHVLQYRCIDGQPTLVNEDEGNGTPPEELPDWQCSDDRGIAVIYIAQDDSSPIDATIEVDLSPAIIKGWKIYQMHTTRLTDGGMINDRRATFSIAKLERHERRRIDILVKGPPGTVDVTATAEKMG